MKRREFLTLVGGVAAWPVLSRAQQPKSQRRIGVLVGLAEDDPNMVARLAALRQGLAKARRRLPKSNGSYLDLTGG
jgi:hypothetical protein